ncbi:uncharacterized protein rab11fip5a [Polymixia lowei]
MSSVNAEEDQIWVPTHVQVTVLRGRGLRGKGKHGTSDVYTIIQVGKEKYSTGVVEKTTSPEWKEECSFELLPGVLEEEDGGRSGFPPGSSDLILTVMHRALIGLDVFLGQAVIPLDKAFRDNICMKNEGEWMHLRSRWFRLNSKTGKKEKERGEIQATVQFTRNNLTASMYDLAMKDKSHSTFSKLKERMRGKKRSCDEDSSSAVLPGGHGGLQRVRHRLPSDGGGEEEYEDDEGGEGRRSKMRNFFLRGKLRKSSDTRSSTSLGSESSESSSRGGSLSPTAGISVVVSDLSNSPSNSSNLTADYSPEHTADTSPKLSPNKSEFGDEAGEITIVVPQPSMCINGSYAYNIQPLDPGSGKPAHSLGLGLLQKSLPLSMSLQNLRPRAEELPKGPAGDGRRWSFDKAGEEEKAAIAAALEQSGPMMAESEQQLGQAAPPLASSSVADSESQGKKQRRNLLSHGRSESAGKGQSQSKDRSEQAPAPAQEKHKGWFGSKDTHTKPSLVVSPKLEPSTDSHLPSLPPSHHPWAPPVDPASLGSPLHHTNPFCPSQSTPPPMSPCNPFFPLLQRNPFYGDMLTDQALTPSPPPLPYLSSSRPPIARLFPQASSSNPAPSRYRPAVEDLAADAKRDVAKVTQRPLPPPPPLTEGEKPLSKKSSNPFMSAGAVEPGAEWDDSFEAFAAGRLQSPEDLTAECKLQQSPREHCNNDKGALLLDANENINYNDALHPPTSGITLSPCTEPLLEAGQVTNQVTHSYTENHVTFAQFQCVEGDGKILATTANSPELGICIETKMVDHNSNTNDITSTNAHQAPCHDCCHIHSTSSPCPSLKLKNNNSPHPGSSGVGCSVEEDGVPSSLSPVFISYLHSASEKLSASSAEDTEAQSVDNCIVGLCEKSSQLTEVEILKHAESEDNVIDRSDNHSADNVAQEMPIQLCNENEESIISEGHEQSLVPPQHPTMELEADDAYTEPPSLRPDILWSDLQLKPPVFSQADQHTCINIPPVLQSDKNNREESIYDLKEPVVDFTEEDNNSETVNNDEEAIIPAILDDDQASKRPSVYIMTSSPGDKESLPGSPFGRDPAFSEFLNTSLVGTSPGQNFDDTLLHTRASDLSPGSLVHSLYASADSQHFQSCRSHPSSACSDTPEEAVANHPAEMLPSANSTLCGVETCDEAGEFQSVADTKSIAASALEDSSGINRIEGLELFQSEAICLFQGKTEPSFTTGDHFGLPMLSNALIDSYISSNPYDHHKLSKGVEQNKRVLLDRLFSGHPLHRSYSERTVGTNFEELLTSPFGSDPGATQDVPSQSQPGSDLLLPLTSPAPSLTAERSSPLALCSLPAPAAASARPPPSAAPALCAAKPATDAPHAALKQETQPQASDQQNSPHPVKPLTTATLVEDKRTEGRSVLASGLEKLKSTIHPGRSSQLSEQEPVRKKSLTEGAGSYYHLTHSELVALLVQREAELQRKKAEFERQGALLTKREAELKKLKPQVRDLEDYIDTLLVRIMEQTPTLLQVRTSKLK